MCNGESCRIEKGNEGPTLNHVYNDLLKRWSAGGHESTPECEDCGCDLTGKEVHETSTQWVCIECKEKDDDSDDSHITALVNYREDFHADG